MKCAYVTLVMLGNAFVKGAVALAKSLIKSQTRYDLICLITDDVTKRSELLKVYTKIIVVPYLYFKCGKMLTERQQNLYNKWIDFSFTKWRCFDLVMYDKCIYLDADQLVLHNIDHLFVYDYAMCFNYNYNAQFKNFKHGDVVRHNVLKFILENYTFVGFTGTLVFKPNKNLSSTIENLLNSNNKLLNMAKNSFHNGFDEIVLTQALIKLHIDVVQLSPMYIWNAGDYEVLKDGLQPYVINYYGDRKPWIQSSLQYMDLYIWKYFYCSKLRN